MEKVAVLLVGWVGARCCVRVRGRLMETWVVVGWLLFGWGCDAAGSCLEDGLEGWSWCGCVMSWCGWQYVGRFPFETTDRGDISLFGWGCRRSGLEVWWCIVWMRFCGVFAAVQCAESGCGSYGMLCRRASVRVKGDLVCAVPLSNLFGATVGCTGCEIRCQVRCGF